MARLWTYKKPNTEEGLIMVQFGKDVFWIKTVREENVHGFEKTRLAEFCQMKSNEGYELDHNLWFAITGHGKVEMTPPVEDPCQESTV